MANPEEELRQFKQYLIGRGKNYENLDEDQLLRWSETFDRYKVLQSQIPAPQAGYFPQLTLFLPRSIKFASAQRTAEDSVMQNEWGWICDNVGVLWENGVNNKKIRTLDGKDWHLINTAELMVRECYEIELAELLRERKTVKKSLFLYLGTAGIGKSGFLQFLLLYLVHEAQTQNRVYSIRLRKFEGDTNPPSDWLLHSDGRCFDFSTAGYLDMEVDFFFSDSQDISESMAATATKGCFLASASESFKAYKLFKKIRGVMTRPIPLFSYEELVRISPFPEPENLIRYAIFGGCARHFLGTKTVGPVADDYQFMRELVDIFFQSEIAAKQLTSMQWENILQYLERSLAIVARRAEDDQGRNLLGSLMCHTNNGIDFFYASTFMKLLAQEIISKEDFSIKTVLKNIIVDLV